jgi:hypothetical protein
MVRHLAKTHPSITYLEFVVEDTNVAQQIMEQQIGVNAMRWGRQGQRAPQKETFKKNDNSLNRRPIVVEH